MNKGAVLALVGLIGYLGFELYAVRKNGYRMEPTYIFSQYVAAGRAVALCGAPEGADTARFARNLDNVRRRAQMALKKTNPEFAPPEIEQELERLTATSVSAVDDVVRSDGCQGREIWKQRRRYEIYARTNTG